MNPFKFKKVYLRKSALIDMAFGFLMTLSSTAGCLIAVWIGIFGNIAFIGGRALIVILGIVCLYLTIVFVRLTLQRIKNSFEFDRSIARDMRMQSSGTHSP